MPRFIGRDARITLYPGRIPDRPSVDATASLEQSRVADTMAAIEENGRRVARAIGITPAQFLATEPYVMSLENLEPYQRRFTLSFTAAPADPATLERLRKSWAEMNKGPRPRHAFLFVHHTSKSRGHGSTVNLRQFKRSLSGKAR